MVRIWRINIKTAAKSTIDPRALAIKENILGIGWPIASAPSDWETYKKVGKETYADRGDKGWWSAINAIKNRMKINDLCWTRDKQGVYYLGRIISDWKYETDPLFKEADLINIRKCEWIEIGTIETIPGKVVNSFNAPRTVQQIHDKTIRDFSMFIFNRYHTSNFYTIEQKENDIYSLLSSDDCEDIVGVYLQYTYNYMIVPSSCKKDTMFYEYVLLSKKTYSPVTVQVKSGKDDLNIDHYVNQNENEVYLFTTKGKYIGEKKPYIHCLCPEDMKEFIFSHSSILPYKVQFWIEFIREKEYDK